MAPLYELEKGIPSSRYFAAFYQKCVAINTEVFYVHGVHDGAP